MHNALGVTPPVETAIYRLWDRPFEVLWGDFPGALGAAITDPVVTGIAQRWPTGSIDRYRDVPLRPAERGRLLRFFEAD